jgi:hypothetical protein
VTLEDGKPCPLQGDGLSEPYGSWFPPEFITRSA